MSSERQPTPYGSPAEELADRVLRAAGSGLRFYTMHSVREAILKAAQDGIDRATRQKPTDPETMEEHNG